MPAPRLLWIEDGDWVVLETEYVESRPPRRPWRQAELDAALDALEVVARELTPAPDDLHLDTVAEELAGWPAYWGHVTATRPDLPHLAEAAALAAGFEAVTRGDTVVHIDVRDDNTLIRPDGTAVFCDWNWPVAGAAWLDSLFMLIGPRGDGLDVEAVLACSAADPRRTGRARRHRAGARHRLLLQVGRRPGAADLAVPP